MIVYRHRRLDNNKIFYIGIGKNTNRAHFKHNRNKFWKNITNKTDYVVEIISENLDLDSARELEIFLISLYGRNDLQEGSLCNMTDGGEGTYGIIKKMPDSYKEYMSKRMKGNQHLLGHTHSEETKRKISESLKGRTYSKETIEKLRKSKLGVIPRKGFKHPIETLNKMRNRDLLLDKKDIKIYMDIDTGIFYTAKDLQSLLNISKYKFYNNFIFKNKYILT